MGPRSMLTGSSAREPLFGRAAGGAARQRRSDAVWRGVFLLELLALCILLAAFALLPPFAEGADGFSTSVMHPSVVPPNGVVSGAFPSGETHYYFAIDAKPGELMTQLTAAGRAGSEKQVQLELLDPSARSRDSVWVHGSSASEQTVRAFPVDAAGRQLMRVTVNGPESARFCLELGGAAFPTTGAGGCPAAEPAASAGAAASRPAPAKIEVIESKCEERLRVGSDVFFDFDRFQIRSEAEPTLAEIGERIAKSTHPIAIEGHTDGKGSDDYNQRLSVERADSVRSYLVAHGGSADRLHAVGFGKKRPVAPNEKADGSDDPAGRQRNRRVEIVIETCA